MREHRNTEKETIDAFLQHCTNAVNDEEVFRSFRHNKYIELIIENSPQEYLNKIYHYFKATNHWALDLMWKFASSDYVGYDKYGNGEFPIYEIKCKKHKHNPIEIEIRAKRHEQIKIIISAVKNIYEIQELKNKLWDNMVGQMKKMIEEEFPDDKDKFIFKTNKEAN